MTADIIIFPATITQDQGEAIDRIAARKRIGRQRLCDAARDKAIEIGKAQVALRDAIAHLVWVHGAAEMIQFADASLMPFRNRELHK